MLLRIPTLKSVLEMRYNNIACQLFSRVEVGKGYKIKVTMNMTYRQFVSEWGGELMMAE